MVLQHLLNEGLSKAAIARQLGVSRRILYYWLEDGDLQRDLTVVAPRQRCQGPTKLAPYHGIIGERLAVYPELSAVRLFQEVRAAGYAGGITQLRDYVAQVRPRPEPEPVVRFETPPGHQAQVDFADFRFPWGKRHALLVEDRASETSTCWCSSTMAETPVWRASGRGAVALVARAQQTGNRQAAGNRPADHEGFLLTGRDGPDLRIGVRRSGLMLAFTVKCTQAPYGQLSGFETSGRYCWILMHSLVASCPESARHCAGVERASEDPQPSRCRLFPRTPARISLTESIAWSALVRCSLKPAAVALRSQ